MNNLGEILCDNSNVDNILKLYNILMDNDIEDSIKNNFSFLISIIPEIKYMVGFLHKHPHHHLDVWEHTLYALSLSDGDFDIRLSLLLHDIGKPFCYTEEDGIRHFRGHPKVSSNMSVVILSRLGFNDEYVKKIKYLIRFHDTVITEEMIDNDYNLVSKLLLIQECDALAHNPAKLEKRKEYLEKTKKLIKEKNQ